MLFRIYLLNLLLGVEVEVEVEVMDLFILTDINISICPNTWLLPFKI
jgi:hypothetical protein